MSRRRRCSSSSSSRRRSSRDGGDHVPMTLTLRALVGGAYTELALRGEMATVPQPRPLRALLAQLAYWHGGPVEVVLRTSLDTAGWLEVWADALGTVPPASARVRVRATTGKRRVAPRARTPDDRGPDKP